MLGRIFHTRMFLLTRSARTASSIWCAWCMGCCTLGLFADSVEKRAAKDVFTEPARFYPSQKSTLESARSDTSESENASSSVPSHSQQELAPDSAAPARNSVLSPAPPERREKQGTAVHGAEVTRAGAVSPRFVGGLTKILAASDHTFFAAGNDGFLTHYTYPDYKPDTWQITPVSIKHCAVHPDRARIAVYETDGRNYHRVSVWNWRTKEILFAKRFTASVVSLSWIVQGSFLSVGTASREGVTVLDGSGNTVSLFSEEPGVVLLTASGPRLVLSYAESGRLTYVDYSKKTTVKRLLTEKNLLSPMLIHNGAHLVGYRDQRVYVIQSSSGAVLTEYPARSACFAHTFSDSLPVWIEPAELKYHWRIRKAAQRSADFMLPDNARITSACSVRTRVIVGTDRGILYELQQGDDRRVTIRALNGERQIYASDVHGADEGAYFLADGSLYHSMASGGPYRVLVRGVKGTRFLPYRDGFIVWSAGKETEFLHCAQKTSQHRMIYRARSTVSGVSVYGRMLVITEPFSGVSVVDIERGIRVFFHKAIGMQDSLLITDDVIVATQSGLQPLVLLHMRTGETYTHAVGGDFAFGVRAHDTQHVYFFSLDTNAGTTDLIHLRLQLQQPTESVVRRILSYKDEDIDAHMVMRRSLLVTNLGKGALVGHRVQQSQVYRMSRAYALPKVAAITSNGVVSVNYDGSVSWYEGDGATLKATEFIRTEDF